MAALKDLFASFVEASEAGDVVSAFSALRDQCGVEEFEWGLEVMAKVRAAVEPQLGYRQKKLFEQVSAFTSLRAEGGSPVPEGGAVNSTPVVVVSGAGPTGLKAAVEAAVLGMRVVIVEKRGEFSRANILTLWRGTADDLIAVGVKLLLPWWVTQGDHLHLGTREIQLCLLKVALLLGVDVRYRWALAGMTPPRSPSDLWSAVLRRHEPSVAKTGALDFKPLKTGDYKQTAKCNMLDTPDVDEAFISKEAGDGEVTVQCSSVVVAEGEWSQTSRAVGFTKTVDRYNQAIGLVINIKYDQTNPIEKKLEQIAVTPGGAHGSMSRLYEEGVVVENVEYLRGTTHFIAVTIPKSSLLQHGVFKEDVSPSSLLLQAANLDVESLKTLSRKIATIIGIPESAPFFEHNPYQLFDFSTRARCYTPCRVLDGRGSTPAVLEPPSAIDAAGDGAKLTPALCPVFPLGDALLEPFWPQGLGCNRGFHSSLDTAYALSVMANHGLASALRERCYSYTAMNAYSWTPKMLLPAAGWKADPLSRYSPLICKAGVELMVEKKSKDESAFVEPPARAAEKWPVTGGNSCMSIHM